MEAVVRTFKQLWRFANDFKDCNLGDHMVLFVFTIAQTWKEFFKINLGVLISIWWCYRNLMSILNSKDLVFDKALFWVLGSGFKFMTSQSTSFLKGWRRVYVISWERSRDRLNQRMMMEAILYGFVSLLILIFPYAVDE